MLRERSDLGLVILAARWAIYAEGRPVSGAGGPYLVLKDDQVKTSSRSINLDVFKQGLQRTVQMLRQAGKDVIILEGLPEIGWDVPTSLALASWWGLDAPPIPEINDVKARNAGVDDAFSKLPTDDGVRIVPTADLLCQPHCKVEQGGRPIYSDDDHISLFAAETVIAPALNARIWRSD